MSTNWSKVNDPRFWRRWEEAGAVAHNDPNRTIVLPQPRRMLKNLLAVSDNDHFQERLYPLFLEHAGAEIVAAGLMVLFALTVSDYASGMPVMESALWMQADEFINAIAGKNNSDVSARAKEMVNEVRQKTQANADQAKAQAKPQRDARNAEGLTDQKFKTFAAARSIADIIMSHTTQKFSANSEKPQAEDRRNEEVNPFYSQTQSGLFLELYYRSPAYLWTPWGKWTFKGSGSGDWRKILQEILPLFGAKIFIEEKNDSNGCHGPVYSLHELQGEPLPEPVVCPRNEFLEYEIAKKEWETLTLALQSQSQPVN